MTLTEMENWSIGVTRLKRELPPAHFSLKVQAYSLLAKTQVEKYDSGVFEAPGGHKWRLSLHPNEAKGGNDYISLYLEIAETDKYPQGWEVYVNYKLFVLDHLQNKYLTIQDADGDLRRFHEGQTEWGFAKLLPLEAFKNPSNGYLVDDTCGFGAEVFVYKRNTEWESLAMVKEFSNRTMSYKLEKFSTLHQPSYLSKLFTVGEKNWRIIVYPNGSTSQKGSLSVYLQYADWKSLPIKRAIYAKYKVRVVDQVGGKHVEKTVNHWFSSLDQKIQWGVESVMSSENLREASKGFIKNDVLVVEVEIVTMSVVKVYS